MRTGVLKSSELIHMRISRGKEDWDDAIDDILNSDDEAEVKVESDAQKDSSSEILRLLSDNVKKPRRLQKSNPNHAAEILQLKEQHQNVLMEVKQAHQTEVKKLQETSSDALIQEILQKAKENESRIEKIQEMQLQTLKNRENELKEREQKVYLREEDVFEQKTMLQASLAALERDRESLRVLEVEVQQKHKKIIEDEAHKKVMESKFEEKQMEILKAQEQMEVSRAQHVLFVESECRSLRLEREKLDKRVMEFESSKKQFSQDYIDLEKCRMQISQSIEVERRDLKRRSELLIQDEVKVSMNKHKLEMESVRCSLERQSLVDARQEIQQWMEECRSQSYLASTERANAASANMEALKLKGSHAQLLKIVQKEREKLQIERQQLDNERIELDKEQNALTSLSLIRFR